MQTHERVVVGMCAEDAIEAETVVETAGPEPVVLSPFLITEKAGIGYLSTTSLSGTRLNTGLKDLGAAISVINPATEDAIGTVAHADKTDLEVHDYVDMLSPVLKAMHAKRLPS